MEQAKKVSEAEVKLVLTDLLRFSETKMKMKPEALDPTKLKVHIPCLWVLPPEHVDAVHKALIEQAGIKLEFLSRNGNRGRNYEYAGELSAAEVKKTLVDKALELNNMDDIFDFQPFLVRVRQIVDTIPATERSAGRG